MHTRSLPVARPLAYRLALRALRVMALGLGLGVAFAFVFRGGFVNVLVYTLCISMACWLFVDGGRWLAARAFQREPAPARRGWPGWGWMTVVIVVGSIAGFSTGSSIAGWWLGVTTPGLFTMRPEQAVPSLIISVFIGVAATYFYWSRSRIATSEARAQKAQRESTETQLRLLQSQLEPHMLFNTLANLRVLIGMDPPRAQVMLDALVDFLRSTLDASRKTTHRLEDEFARCGDYLALMRVRMGARLVTESTLPAALAGVPVPTLLLQPLVENAVKHGLEPKVEGGRVAIAAHRDDGSLVLTVRDSGLGPGEPAATSGFGLVQVRERLATMYGEAASLTLEAAPAGGTVATVRLPLPNP